MYGMILFIKRSIRTIIFEIRPTPKLILKVRNKYEAILQQSRVLFRNILLIPIDSAEYAEEYFVRASYRTNELFVSMQINVSQKRLIGIDPIYQRLRIFTQPDKFAIQHSF